MLTCVTVSRYDIFSHVKIL